MSGCPHCAPDELCSDHHLSAKPALKLFDLALDYRRAITIADEAREIRNEAIREAIASGMTHAQVSEATELTRGRIGQIIHA